jgi:hypothetical protein
MHSSSTAMLAGLTLVMCMWATGPRGQVSSLPAGDPSGLTSESKWIPGAVTKRLLDVQAELATTTNPWAGHYRSTRPPTTLWWAPEAGFVFERAASKRGNPPVALYHGAVHLEKEYLRIEPPEDMPPDVRVVLGFRMALVQWDSRQYLIPNSQMIDFCNRVNSGLELEYGIGTVLLRDSAPGRAPLGLPQVTEEWSPYLLVDPVDCDVLAINVTRAPALGIMRIRVEITVDAGRERGLMPGMRLVRADIPDLLWYRVEEAHPKHATAVLEGDSSAIPSTLLIGAPMSTRRFVHKK